MLLFTSLLIVVGIFGCNKDPLNQQPTGEYTNSNFWTNQTNVLEGITGIYNALYPDDWIGHNLYIFDDQSDDISANGNHPDFLAVERFNIDPTLSVLYWMWPFAYEQIARANNAILYIPKVPVMDDSIRKRSMGEAYFLRAYAYYQLQCIYGAVPIMLPANVVSGSYNVPSSPVDSVRALVESDLLNAVAMLPATYDDADKGRVSSGAAAGMLCKLYMQEDNFTKAIQYGDMVVNNPDYALAPNYANNFTSGLQETDPEILFAVWNKNGETGPGKSTVLNMYFTPGDWQGWGFHHPTENFAEAFEPGDPRKNVTLLSIGDSIPHQTNLVTISGTDASQMFAGKAGQQTGRLLPSMTSTGYIIRKYSAFLADGSGGLDNNLKQPLLRSSDIYLLVAEAKIRLSGAGSGDAEINAVRERAGLGPLLGAGMSELIHERRVELGGENVRWQDLLRWDKDKIIDLDTIVGRPKMASPLPPYNSTIVVPARTFTRPKDYYMPIPQEVIDESKGVIKQNPNY